MYHYYVSYAHTAGFGAIEYGTSEPLTTYEQIAKMAEEIRQKECYRNNVIVLNYILLRKEN